MIMKSFHAMRQNEISDDNVLGMQMIKNGMIVREKMNLMKWKRNRESMNLRLQYFPSTPCGRPRSRKRRRKNFVENEW